MDNKNLVHQYPYMVSTNRSMAVTMTSFSYNGAQTIPITNLPSGVAFNTQTSIKLTNANFPAWRVQFNALLVGYEFIGLLMAQSRALPHLMSIMITGKDKIN